jgi:hypothetical protein
LRGIFAGAYGTLNRGDPAAIRELRRGGIAAYEPSLERTRRGSTRIAEIRISSGAAADSAATAPPAIEWRNGERNLSRVDFKHIMLRWRRSAS